MPTTIIFVSPLCTGPAKHVCSLMRLSSEHAVRFERMAVHPNVARRNGADFHDVHRRANRHAHRLFGDAERLDHRPLAFGRAAVVRAHRGEQKRLGPVIAQPIAGGPRDFSDVGDSAAAGRDADIALAALSAPADRAARARRREYPQSDWRPVFDERARSFTAIHALMWMTNRLTSNPDRRPVKYQAENGRQRVFVLLANCSLAEQIRQLTQVLTALQHGKWDDKISFFSALTAFRA